MQAAVDYYGYEPLVQLRQPLVVTGHPGSDLREIAYDLAALTGLTVHDLDHRIAHEVGKSPWALRRQQGVETYLECAASLAPSLLTSRPAGIVVVGIGTLEARSELSDLACESSTVIFLRVDSSTMYWHLRQLYGQGRFRHPLLPDNLRHPDDLASLLADSQATMARSDLVIDVTPGQVHPAVTALHDYVLQQNLEFSTP
ncbi:MAG: shikimate kinase [Candidatus Latescibacterota bacterium]|nr:shikimate kinase [Candidatus Latescibacterota bacterium]